MAFDKTAQDTHRIAREVVNLIINAGNTVETAKNQVLINRYDMLISIPQVQNNLETRISAAIAGGFDGPTLAPIVADLFDMDVTNFTADLAALRTAMSDLKDLIVSNGTLITHSIDENGNRTYDQPLTSGQQAAVISHLDDVLALYV